MKARLTPDFGLIDRVEASPTERWVLPNGLTLVVREDASAPVASVQVWVGTGSLHEDVWLGSGVSHFVEHMLFKGTEKRAGRDISRTVQEHGGYINAYTTFDRTVYYIDLPSAHTGVALDVLADAVLHSTFPEDEFTREREVILREIDMGRDDPDHRLSEALFETAYRRHPHRYPIIGYKDVFSRLTREDLWSYYRARYVPNNLVVVVVGDVRPLEVKRQVEATFGRDERRRLAPVRIDAEPRQLAPRTQLREEDVEVCRVGLAWPLPGLSHPDAPALDLLAGVLGGGDSSRLWQQVREKARLVHAIDAHSWTPAEAGLFYISFTCDAAKREKAILAVQRELARALREGFLRKEIAKAQGQLIVAEVNGRKTVSGQAGRLGVAELIVGDLGHTRTYFASLRKVTSARLQALVQTYLIDQPVTTVALVPKTPAAEAAPVAPTPRTGLDFERIDLPNGASLLVQENQKLPNVHLRVAFLGGVWVDAPEKRGGCSLLATLLTKDTRTRSAAAVAEAIEEVGGVLYPFSGNNSFGVAAEVLPADFELAFTLVREAVTAPTFLATTLAAEKEAQIAEIKQDLDDVVSLTRRQLRRRFFGDHPLAVDVSGDPDQLATLTPADLRALHRRCVVAGNTVLVITGAIDRRRWLPKLKAWLSKLPAGKLSLSLPPWTAPAQPGAAVLHQPREQAVVTQAYPGPGLHDADFYVSEVMDELFSGMSSRLFERVRDEKGLAYFIRSSRIIGMNTGMFSFLAGTHPRHADEVLAEINAEVARVASGQVEAGELQRCQTRLKAGRVMGLQTNASRATLAALNTLYGYPVNEWNRYPACIDAVTLDDLARFARTYLRPELLTQLITRPTE